MWDWVAEEEQALSGHLWASLVYKPAEERAPFLAVLLCGQVWVEIRQ